MPNIYCKIKPPNDKTNVTPSGALEGWQADRALPVLYSQEGSFALLGSHCVSNSVAATAKLRESQVL